MSAPPAKVPGKASSKAKGKGKAPAAPSQPQQSAQPPTQTASGRNHRKTDRAQQQGELILTFRSYMQLNVVHAEDEANAKELARKEKIRKALHREEIAKRRAIEREEDETEECMSL